MLSGSYQQGCSRFDRIADSFLNPSSFKTKSQYLQWHRGVDEVLYRMKYKETNDKLLVAAGMGSYKYYQRACRKLDACYSEGFRFQDDERRFGFGVGGRRTG